MSYLYWEKADWEILSYKCFRKYPAQAGKCGSYPEDYFKK